MQPNGWAAQTCKDKVKGMPIGINDWGEKESMIIGEDTGLKVKSIGRNWKNQYWYHLKNYDNNCSEDIDSDQSVKHLQGVKESSRWDTKISVL